MLPDPNHIPCLLLAGPTAVGKSEVALLLSEKIQGEIISVDSMQVYRGLDIGTAKPSAACQGRVPHHLIDIVDLSEAFDAARFVAAASDAVISIHSRGKIPILCGGTGLYFKAFLHGLGEAPPASQSLRDQLDKIPLPELLNELAAGDPATYERIDRNNRRRVARAVEVTRLTGKPFSQQRANWARETLNKPVLLIALSRESQDLRTRIDKRVDEMFRFGLKAETEALLKGGLARNPTAMQALGYRQVAEHLQGVRPLDETVELVKVRTRQFAKRQMTWFRNQLNFDWMTVTAEDTAELVAGKIREQWEVFRKEL